jgi:hypothetical protein
LSTASLFPDLIWIDSCVAQAQFRQPAVGEVGVEADVGELLPEIFVERHPLVGPAGVHQPHVIELTVDDAAEAAAADHATADVLVDGRLCPQRGQGVDGRRGDVRVGIVGGDSEHRGRPAADRHDQQVALACLPAHAVGRHHGHPVQQERRVVVRAGPTVDEHEPLALVVGIPFDHLWGEEDRRGGARSTELPERDAQVVVGSLGVVVPSEWV